MKFIASFLFIPFTILLSDNKPRISASELRSATGRWTGSLTYIDYGTKKPYTMPANFSITLPDDMPDHLIIFNEYPDEPKANSFDTLTITGGGHYFNGAKVLKKTKKGGTLEFLTEAEGMDDERPATIRIRYTAGPHTFIMKKEVRFAPKDTFMLRHIYQMSR